MQNINTLVKNKKSLDLKHSFMDACSNKAFYEFIKTLPIEEEILIKYTSKLEDAEKEYSNCKNCKGFSSCKNQIKGYCYSPIKENDTINFSYIMCKKLSELEKEKEYLKNINYYEVSEELKKASFKDLYKDDVNRVPILKYITEFIKKYQNNEKVKGLYLNGSFGSGKTYLISALFNDMAKKGYKCAIVYYPEFLRDLKASFNKDYEEKFNYIKKTDLLLLDDIGAENVTSFNRDEVLGPILQYRMEEDLPTFFTSNLTLEELENNLSLTSSGVDRVKARRIIERIKQLTIEIKLVSKNRR